MNFDVTFRDIMEWMLHTCKNFKLATYAFSLHLLLWINRGHAFT